MRPGRQSPRGSPSLPAADVRPVIRDALRRERGTLLEPFRVEDRDVEEAADLGVIALSAGWSLRVVSRDKLQPHGGLVMRLDGPASGSLETTYQQRLATKPQGDPAGREVRFVPVSAPAVGDLEAGRAALWARSSIDDDGHVIELGPLRSATPFPNWYPDCEISGQPPLPRGSWLARVFGDPVQDDRVRPRGPEVAIQVTALMLQRRWIVTQDLRGGAKGPRVAIRLAPPNGTEPVALRVLGELSEAATGRLEGWLQAPGLPLRAVFSGDLKREVGTWLGLPAEWMRAELLEGYA